MSKKIDVIATLNHHLLEEGILKALYEGGATLFRINGSHVKPNELQIYASTVRKALGQSIKLLVDLPGNKIRTGLLTEPIILAAGKPFDLRREQINYPGFISHLLPGDELLANDSLFKFRVQSVSENKAVLLSKTDGVLESNKGMHLIGKSLDLPFIFERDRELVHQAIENDFDYIGFSFVRTAADVRAAKELIQGSKIKMIIKVETAPAVQNLSEILNEADEFLVDRGDLGCDIGIENIDRTQKFILRQAKSKGKKVFFATQFFHSMVQNNSPLIAEACGLSDALKIGVDGIQLSEETAIGKHPLEILSIIKKFSETEQKFKIRPRQDTKTGLVLWLTGRSGAGKTTVSHQLIRAIDSLSIKACLIDGDEYRAFFDNQAGYTKEERIRNLQNISFTAFLAAKIFDVVVVSSLSPYREIRNFARRKISNFHEIYIDCSQNTCKIRDPKGHYAKTTDGKIQNFVGVTEEYEVPEKPDFTVNTEKLSIQSSTDAILEYLLDRSGNEKNL